MAINTEIRPKPEVLPGQLDEPRFDRHRGPVTCVAGIPGRAAAVSSGYDSAVAVVDFESGLIDLLGYHRHLVNRVIVNASGSLAATCSSDYTVGLWDLKNLTPLQLLQGHWDDVEDFAFVDDNTGISVSRDRRIFIWNLTTGAIKRVLEKHDRDVLSVEYAKGKIYSSGDDMTLRQWDLESGELLRTWGPFEVETDTCSIDPLFDRVVLGSDDGNIRIFDCNSGTALHQIVAHRSGIKKVAISPINGDILSAAYDQRILVWDAETFELKLELESHAATWERSFNWAPDGRSILAGTFDGTVLRWDTESGRRISELGGESMPAGNACLNDVDCDSDGLTVLVSDDGYVRLARLSVAGSTWKESVEPVSGRMLMNAVCLVERHSAESIEKLVLAGAHDQKLHLFRLADDSIRDHEIMQLNEGPINCIRVARTESDSGIGRHANECAGVNEAFVACYSGSIVRVPLNGFPNSDRIRKLPIHNGAVKSLRLHPQGLSGISGAADGSLFSWNFDGSIIHRFSGHTAIVDDVDFNPAGTSLASVSRDFTVNIYQHDNGVLQHSILLGRESPKCVLFWDEHTVIVGNYWGDLWRVSLPDEKVTAFRIAINGISSLARCGHHIVAVSYDGSVCLVDPVAMSVVNRIRTMQQKLSHYETSTSFD